MYSKLPSEVNAGIYNRVASLWFVAMVVIFQAGKNISTTPVLSHTSGVGQCCSLQSSSTNKAAGPHSSASCYHMLIRDHGWDGMVSVAGNNALNIAYAQKPLLRREVHSGHYSYLVFYIAKGLTSLPLQQAYTTIFSVAAYFLVSCSPVTTCFPHTMQLLHDELDQLTFKSPLVSFPLDDA